MKKEFHIEVAEKLISQIEQGTAPWQKSWAPGEIALPHNGSTGHTYQGFNRLWLMCQPHEDSRWMTYRQASEMGAQVRKGEKGTGIIYWKTHGERQMKDDSGKPVPDENGKPRMVYFELDKPMAFHAIVFNAEQMDGLPPREKQEREVKWERHEEAEALLKFAVIKHDQGDRAFYRPSTDEIHMPGRDQFPDAIAYYQTAFHEMGHWTGHQTRLARDLSDPFGSPGYAREELRAEIASVLVGAELGIGHEPRPENAAYVGQWIKRLQEDPKEIFKAAVDAQKIILMIMELSKEKTLGQGEPSLGKEEREPVPEEAGPPAKEVPATTEKVYLAVPFSEKNAAKALGAKWDFEQKSWYAADEEALGKLSKWLPRNQGQATREEGGLSPRDEFARALQDIGFTLSVDHPVMDGQPHRATVEGDKKGEAAGFYVGYPDGHPAGYGINNRTGEEIRWKAKGYAMTEEQRAVLAAEAATRQRERAEQLRTRQEQAARRVEEQTKTARQADSTPYLERKQVSATKGTYVSEDGKTLLIPGFNADGKITTGQYVTEEGVKRYAKGSEKEGSFHVMHGYSELARRPAIVIAEGYSTAATISEALGSKAAVVSAFDAGNLEAVARALREKFPGKPILVAADDDQLEKSRQRGQRSAIQAAESIGCEMVAPVFATGEQSADPGRFSDFNDLKVHSKLGIQGAREQLEQALAKAVNRHQAQERPQERERRELARAGREGDAR